MITRVIVLGAALCAAPASCARADAPSPLLAATPLVMKDGRMAQVSVRVIPFQPGGDVPDAAAAAGLDALAAELATDCFLSGQAVGHVEAALAEGADPVAAHRIARARAARVQEALVAHGLPETGVAAFWDWRFTVREPRVTLWVFQLQRGADCTGAPLDTTPAVMVLVPRNGPTPAAEPPPMAADAPGEPVLPTRLEAPEEPTEPAAVPVPVIASAAGAESPVAAAPVVAATPETASPPGPAAVAELAAEAAASPVRPPAPKPAMVAMAAVMPAAGPAEVPGTRAGPVAEPGARGVDLVFDLNSSYLPPSASGQLKRLIAGMARDRHWRVVLTASVSAAESSIPDGKEARRYNRWLAERRLWRVAGWLDDNAEIRKLALVHAYTPGDASRRVRIEVTPVS